jgi:hypothetical protein
VLRPYLITALIALFGLELATDARVMFWKKTPDEPVDVKKSVAVKSRIPCEASTSPEDQLRPRVTFSSGNSERSFTISVYEKDVCKVDLKVKCFHTAKAGFRDVWSTDSSHPPKTGTVDLRSCYEWGSPEPAQYMISGWYKEGGPNPKLPWKQAALKQVSTKPDVYEFTDPQGGTARLELSAR